jgi:[ribosomal protein S18]-alanine N-acetyltransferase
MLVRPARTEDAEAWASVYATVAEERRWIATEPPVDLEGAARTVRESIADAAHALWVLEAEGEVVGCLGVHSSRYAAGVADLGMMILPAFRGRGGGRALLGAALERARADGVHKVELEVWPDNGRAIALYARAGFVVEGMRRDHYLRKDGSRRSALIMARFLQEAPPPSRPARRPRRQLG